MNNVFRHSVSIHKAINIKLLFKEISSKQQNMYFQPAKEKKLNKKYLGQHLISIILKIALTGATHVAFDTCSGAIAIETFFAAATFRQLRA